MTFLTTLGIFVLIAISAKKIGQLFSKVGLPYITGYLLVGVLAGPFVFGILPKETTADLRFNHQEAAAFLQQAMQLNLNAADIAALEGLVADLKAESLKAEEARPGMKPKK